ncbi:MAG: AAA family ATPase [Candidatus Poribacteria bacterium]|nr:AAA family ATPase [Candidatus Poribacteria bacterium]
MLHALELENFKAFGKRARIPFAPITLIFGENSAGKSSILQALNLLKQTLESRNPTEAPLLPKTENGIVDLGSFQEMLFDHDLERTLSIRVETTLDSLYSLRFPLYRKNKIAIEFSFKRPSLEAEVYLDQIGIYYAESGECIAKFQRLDTTEESEAFLRGMSFSRPLSGILSSRLTALKCVWLTAEPEYWKWEFEWHKEKKEGILNELREMLTALQHANDEHKEDNKRLQQECRSLNDGIEFFSSDFDLKTYISKRHDKEVNGGIGVYGFLPIGGMGPPHRRKFRPLLHRLSDDIIFSAPKLAIAAGGALELDLVYLFPMSSFRRPPERLYIFTGTSPEDVGYRGDLLPDLLLRRPELVKDTNEWLNRLNMDYELEVKPVGTDTGDLFEVRLIDTRRKEGVSVALTDVGFGISQLLPFIVQSLVSEERIISIEQPEVHVHPKLQADLGDLLAEAIKEPRQNRFIIETHSEHLILRLQRLIRNKLLEPEDVSVIYVSRGPEGAKALRLHLDEDGDFIDEWPNGFFLERLREL